MRCGYGLGLRAGRLGLVAALCPLLVQAIAAASGPYTDAYRRDVVQALSADVSKALANRDPQTAKVLQQRLALVDQLAMDILGDLEALNAGILEDELAGLPRAAGPSSRGARPINRTAAEMVEDYLARLPDAPATADAEPIELSQETRRLRAASRCLLEAGRQVVPADDQVRREAVEKSAVFALLAVPDEAWSEADVKALPEWVRRPQNLPLLEALALRLKRPRTAYRVSCHAAAAPAGAAAAKEPYVQYLVRAARSLATSQEYELAVYCLQAGLASVEGEDRRDTSAELRYQLASILDEMGHGALAVEQTRMAMAEVGQSAQRGKIASAQLMYLYKAKRFSEAIEESSAYIADPVCQPYLPYLLYVRWLAFRSQDDLALAGKVQREFLARFPSHSLAVDMAYASAADAIMRGEFQEAARLLDQVEQKYHDPAWTLRIAQLHENLRQIMQPASK